MFLKELIELSGISGCEQEVRNYITQKLKNINCEYYVDKLGNIIAHNVGLKRDKKTMITAHMDEVGFMVAGFDLKGYIKFISVGDVDIRTLNSKIVTIGENKVLGVIGSNPVHSMKPEEKGKTLPIESLYIDIGCNCKSEAETYVKLGDYVAFKSDYIEFGKNLIKSKAMDSRMGCDILLRILHQKLETDYYAAFTVMQETGLIGSSTASYAIEPEVSIVIDAVACGDIQDDKDHESITELGKGPAVIIMDTSVLYNKESINHIIDIAKNHNIPIQTSKGVVKGNDAGPISISRSGCSIANICVPCRYLHSPVNVASMDDFENTFSLIKLMLTKLW